MNASVSMGPVAFMGLTYLTAVIISFGVAGIISLIVGIINRQKSAAAAKAAAAHSAGK